MDFFAMDRYLSLILLYIYTVALFIPDVCSMDLKMDKLFLKYKLCILPLQFREAVERQDVFLCSPRLVRRDGRVVYYALHQCRDDPLIINLQYLRHFNNYCLAISILNNKTVYNYTPGILVMK